MEIAQALWRVDKAVESMPKINFNPFWQRGPAWNPRRQSLLVDSILRGLDIPKFYLRRLDTGGAYDYEVVDGQQRLRAIKDFRHGDLKIEYSENLADIDGFDVNGNTYSDLPVTLQNRFDSFIVSLAIIDNADMDQITGMFARLQMGVALNPAELRNAIPSPVRHVVDTIATSHQFFSECRIPNKRYKHQDYVSHVFALALYDGSTDIKAPDLRRMFKSLDHSDKDSITDAAAKIGDALNILREVNIITGNRIIQKWIFVDLLWFILRRKKSGSTINVAELSESYVRFDQERLKTGKKPEQLLANGNGPTNMNRHMYNYISAFRSQAGKRESVTTRAAAMDVFLVTS